MRVMFLYPNNEGYFRCPIGLTLIMTMVEDDGHSVELFDTTFKYVKDKELLSEDMRIANKVSKLLDINILNLFFNYEDIDKKIFNILDSSQDWRDYNVHCAVLNYFIAENDEFC